LDTKQQPKIRNEKKWVIYLWLDSMNRIRRKRFALGFTALEPYRPIFIGLTLLFLGFAFYRLYLVRPACSPESGCANPRTLKRQRLLFWIVTVLVLGLVAVPWVAPLFY